MSKFLLISTALVLAVLAANADAFCCPWTLNQVGVPKTVNCQNYTFAKNNLFLIMTFLRIASASAVTAASSNPGSAVRPATYSAATV